MLMVCASIIKYFQDYPCLLDSEWVNQCGHEKLKPLIHPDVVLAVAHLHLKGKNILPSLDATDVMKE